MPLTLSDAQQGTFLFNLAMLLLLAWSVGFWMGERNERKFRDKIDAIREGREDANGRKA